MSPLDNSGVSKKTAPLIPLLWSKLPWLEKASLKRDTRNHWKQSHMKELREQAGKNSWGYWNIPLPPSLLLKSPKTSNIKKAGSSQEQSRSLNFITTFNSSHNIIRHILNKNWFILQNDPLLKDTIPDRPKMIFKRAPTIKNILCCKEICHTWTHIKSSHSDEVFNIKYQICDLSAQVHMWSAVHWSHHPKVTS